MKPSFIFFLSLWGVSLMGQGNPIVMAQSYTGLTIHGTVGASYSVQYVQNLEETNWQTLTNLVLSINPLLYVDTSAPQTTQRFYRVVPTVKTNAPPPAGMVLIPAGSFVMGDTLDGETDAPTNTEYISGFYIDSTLITFALWQQVASWAASNGYSFDNPGAGNASNQPVQSISWFDSVKWCNARSERAGVPPVYFNDAAFTQVFKTGDTVPYPNWTAPGYRLPTEAEWEKAARGGTPGLRFPFGNTISEAQANYYGESTIYTYDEGPSGYNPAFGNGIGVDTSPVTYFPTTGFGLYDMAGNLFEWCWDWYGPYVTGVQTDPHGPGAGSFRVLRGGSWLIGAYNCRTANRSYYYPALNGNGYGFRAVLPATQ